MKMSKNRHSTRKPARLPEKATSRPFPTLREAFKTFQLDELKSELKRWLYVGISNNNSVYEDDQERRNLIRFRKEFRKLAEALSVVNRAHRPKKEIDWLTQLQPALRAAIEKRSQPTSLNKEQLANPMMVVKQFCKRFTRKYANREMRDWLEAVITYNGKYPKAVSKDYLLIFYECLLCLIEIAFALAEKD
jgi:hypothetical protein